MAAHLRPRGQTTTTARDRSRPISLKPAAGKCSGLLGGVLLPLWLHLKNLARGRIDVDQIGAAADTRAWIVDEYLPARAYEVGCVSPLATREGYLPSGYGGVCDARGAWR